MVGLGGVNLGLAEYIDSMLRELIHSFSQALPSQCEVCHAWPAHPVCEACVARFAQPLARCRTCALPVPLSLPEGLTQCGTCLRSPPPLDACLAAVTYSYPWAELIARYKFAGAPGWAALFAQILRSMPWMEPALDQADLLLPMPLSKERLQERGFNQSLEIARHLTPAKIDTQLLLRIRHSGPQSLLHRRERQRNVENAFAVEPLRSQLLQQKRVVLLDDVMTSGASLHSAAKVLRQAGAAHITAMVLARTEN
jgi:ComF family protein